MSIGTAIIIIFFTFIFFCIVRAPGLAQLGLQALVAILSLLVFIVPFALLCWLAS